MMMEQTGALSAAETGERAGAPAGLRWRPRKRNPAKRAPRNGRVARLKKACRQLQQKLTTLEAQLKRQSADTCGLQALYDQLVNEIKHHRDMLQLDSFDADKSAAIYSQAWRRFMTGHALDYQTHRHTSSRSRLPLF
jgi:hypothetical protein